MNNTRQIFWASFLTLIAAGMGFSIRGGILGDWGEQFGFTKGELGTITGGGLIGFGFTIIGCSLFIDKVGYKPLMIVAFLLHVGSAIVTLAATPVYDSMISNGDAGAAKDATYALLFWGMFMFSLANGVCEAVINPLVATMYPRQKTHYLNILHAGWPAGLIVGGLLAYFFCGRGAVVTQLQWEIPMCFFLAPTLWYGIITVKEKFPISEAKAAGIGFGTMMKEFAAPMMIFLLFLHALIGYVELGTDSWITNIMNNVIQGRAILLLVYTAGIMFVLRFFAGPIVEKINPLGLLFVTAVLGSIGLYSLGEAQTGTAIIVAATIYGVGKTFFWPTMLGVVGERFPRGGALTMGAVGGVGMLSAGFLGGPGIGYTQDYFASEKLKQESAEVYEAYASTNENVLRITGLDGQKVGDVQEKIDTGATLSADEELVRDAGIYGGRMALKWTAVVPATMAVGFLILVIYFMSVGGYKVEVLHGAEPEGEHYTGGVEGPMEA